MMKKRLITIEEFLQRYEESMLLEFVAHASGHKNSKGESAPWVIKSHETGKILSSHKSESAAKKHLQQMHIYKR